LETRKGSATKKGGRKKSFSREKGNTSPPEKEWNNCGRKFSGEKVWLFDCREVSAKRFFPGKGKKRAFRRKNQVPSRKDPNLEFFRGLVGEKKKKCSEADSPGGGLRVNKDPGGGFYNLKEGVTSKE